MRCSLRSRLCWLYLSVELFIFVTRYGKNDVCQFLAYLYYPRETFRITLASLHCPLFRSQPCVPCARIWAATPPLPRHSRTMTSYLGLLPRTINFVFPLQSRRRRHLRPRHPHPLVSHQDARDPQCWGRGLNPSLPSRRWLSASHSEPTAFSRHWLRYK